jgi:hypothetical protein
LITYVSSLHFSVLIPHVHLRSMRLGSAEIASLDVKSHDRRSVTTCMPDTVIFVAEGFSGTAVA